ncbi:MAG: hypothetical protein QOF98_3637 [Streptomyces sp.]|jgi:hypothetical protein|nr:hypothetical protein [Streptomyces sp.]
MTRATRTQAERDATTVEIGYALASAAFLAALVFGVIAGPSLVWDLPPRVDKALLVTGVLVAAVLAVIRVVHVLRLYARAERG